MAGLRTNTGMIYAVFEAEGISDPIYVARGTPLGVSVTDPGKLGRVVLQRIGEINSANYPQIDDPRWGTVKEFLTAEEYTIEHAEGGWYHLACTSHASDVTYKLR